MAEMFLDQVFRMGVHVRSHACKIESFRGQFQTAEPPVVSRPRVDTDFVFRDQWFFERRVAENNLLSEIVG